MIVIMGVPGAGKSTLAKLLSVREDLPLFPEPVETNPYLEDYYKNPSEYAFKMQTFLLHKRFLQAQEAEKLEQCVMDMGISGNDIFALLQYSTGLMNEIDYQTYMGVSDTYKSIIRPPDLVVYLQCSTNVAINRIIRRGRVSELKAPMEYWFQLNEAYEKWYNWYRGSKKILINVDDIDFVSDYEEEDYTIDSILESLI